MLITLTKLLFILYFENTHITSFNFVKIIPKYNLLKRIWTQKNENQLAVILKLKFRLDERDTRSFEFGCNA